MTFPSALLQSAHLGIVLLAGFTLAFLGGTIARRLRQPAVIGEIAVGLGIGPLLLAAVGPDTFERMLPEPVSDVLLAVGQVGLVLFLVAIARELDFTGADRRSRTVTMVGLGAFVPPLVVGAGFAVWLTTTQDGHSVAGTSTAAFVLVVAVCFAVTAVPVLARILMERHMIDTPVGRLAMTVAAGGDAAAWILLTAAVGLASGGLGAAVRAVAILVVGVGGAVLLRRVLSMPAVHAVCARRPQWMACVIGFFAIAVAGSLEHIGLTAVIAAVLVGIAIPRGGENGVAWDRAMSSVTRVGKALVPSFFVAVGVGVLTSPLASSGWHVIVLACVLGCAAKVAGTYAGARLAGQAHWDGARLGVLMNARGVTEFVFLQAAYSAGILTPAMFLTLAVMALTTTAVTGPLLSMTNRLAARGSRTSFLTSQGGVT